MEDQPFYRETQELFRCVSDHDFDALANLCDDDFGIVDLDEHGKNVIVHDRDGWEEWFLTLFKRLDTMKAETGTNIQKYEALKEEKLGYCVVNFCQWLKAGQQKAEFDCVATIIWKKTDNGWKESRWHCSLISRRG